jgi:hypothetical protein
LAITFDCKGIYRYRKVTGSIPVEGNFSFAVFAFGTAPFWHHPKIPALNHFVGVV